MYRTPYGSTSTFNNASGCGQGLLDDGAEISAAEVHALKQEVAALKSDFSALKTSAGMWNF